MQEKMLELPLATSDEDKKLQSEINTLQSQIDKLEPHVKPSLSDDPAREKKNNALIKAASSVVRNGPDHPETKKHMDDASEATEELLKKIDSDPWSVSSTTRNILIVVGVLLLLGAIYYFFFAKKGKGRGRGRR